MLITLTDLKRNIILALQLSIYRDDGLVELPP